MYRGSNANLVFRLQKALSSIALVLSASGCSLGFWGAFVDDFEVDTGGSSTLAVRLTPRMFEGSCYPIEIRFRDESMQFIQSAGVSTVELESTGAVFSDSDCSGSVTTLLAGNGDWSVKGYVRPTTAGTITVRVSVGDEQVTRTIDVQTPGTSGEVDPSSLTGLDPRHLCVFDPTSAGGAIHSMTPLSGGGVVLAGTNIPFGYADSRMLAVKFNAEGECDSTFGSGGVFSYWIDGAGFSVTRTSGEDRAGRILLAGASGSTTEIQLNSTNHDLFIARLRINGTLDPSFGAGGIVKIPFAEGGSVGKTAYDLKVQDDGKIVVVGRWGAEFLVARFLEDGTRDTSFASGGVFTLGLAPSPNVAYSLEIDSQGRYVVTGQCSSDYFVSGLATRNCFFRLTPQGILDTTFGTGGAVIMAAISPHVMGDAPFVNSALQSDDKLLVLGTIQSAANYRPFILRLLQDGGLDPSFGVGGQYDALVEGSSGDGRGPIEVSPEGKIYILANRQTGGDTMAPHRLNSNGTLDTAFGGGDGQSVLGRLGAGFSSGGVRMPDGRVAYHVNDYASGAAGLILFWP